MGMKNLKKTFLGNVIKEGEKKIKGCKIDGWAGNYLCEQ